MKFVRLYLKAFGPFRDRVIDLPSAAGKDLHVVFGPNEAGKSTILRAVTGFLFGIPERTGDAFLHDYSALRVGAILLLPDGSRIAAMRRKARKATLFPIDEALAMETTERPLVESTIADLLGGLDQPLYQNLFGLDLAGLVAGSDELLRGEGEVGRSLFQAAAGLASLRGLIAGLEDEATALFKPRGSTGRLNRALSEFDEKRRTLKEATVRSSAWEAADREYRQAQARHLQLRDALKAKRTEQQRLERIRNNLPLVAERTAKRTELAPLGDVPALSPDAAQRRVAAQERLRVADETKLAAEAELARLRTALAGVVVRSAVLDNGSAIEEVFHGISAYRTAREALPRIAAERSARTETIRQLLGQIDPACSVDRAAALVPRETLAARVQALIEEHARLTALDDQLDAQARAKGTARDRLAGRLASLAVPAPVNELEASLASVANVADLEARHRKFDRDIADLDGKLQREAAALWAGTRPELIALAVPLAQSAAHFEAEFAALVQDERLVAEKEAELTRHLADRRRELTALGATGEVVTQSEVAAARSDRDASWSRLRRRYVDRIADAAELPGEDQAPTALANAFEQTIKEADRLADLLHADTQRATNFETTRQRISDMQVEMQRIEQDREQLAAKRQNLQDRWLALIAPLRRAELTPAALREWLSRHERLLERDSDLENLRRERDGVAADLARARALLDRALLACGLAGWAGDETAASALARAQQAVQAARKARAERDLIEDQIEAAKDELRAIGDQQQQVTTKLGDWRESWSQAAASLRLSTGALPAEAKTRLDQLSRLATALGDLAKLDGEAGTQRAAVAGFESRITELATAVEEPAEGREMDAVAQRLYAALREARGAQTKRQQLTSDAERETRTRDQAASAAAQAKTQLDALVRQAECLTTDELPEVEGKAARKHVLRQRLTEIEEQLVQQNARPIDEVVRESEGLDLDALTRQIDDVAAEIEDLEAQVETAQSTRIGAKQLFDAIDGGAAAAEAQQALSSLSARISKEARSYARARLASAVLNQVVQVYRDRHQGPLLQRAANVFARITLGSFSGLTVDYDNDRQVLFGARADGSRVPVGGMSQGTRDQLFLSLRLAAIEQHLESRGPMPVIIDDLLVQFDDDRALAAMEVLAELSGKTQVLFFTHHRHLIDLAQRSKVGAAISVHNLEACADAT